jgi:ribosome-associated protein
VIEIIDGLSIPENEVAFKTSRSGGPGGQNVNKVSTRVTLEWNIQGSQAISEDQRRRIENKLASRISKEGIFRVVSQRTRSQDMNRTDAVERFISLLQDALRVNRTRVKTRVPKAARERRITGKKIRTVTKQLRAKKSWDAE